MITFEQLPENIKNKIQIFGPHWLWIGAVANENREHKQGVVRFDGTMRKINRVTLYLAGELDLDGKLQANHKTDCNMELCCNPEHLYAGTQQQNIKDRDNSGRNFQLKKTHCPLGHEFSVSPTTGNRFCQICANIKRDEWRKKKRAMKCLVIDS